MRSPREQPRIPLYEKVDMRRAYVISIEETTIAAAGSLAVAVT
jgi:hypothetical protein